MSAVTVRGLHVSYGDLVALRGVDLDVRPGSAVAVLGANGAGKSSLLGAISGAVRPVVGRIDIDGRDAVRRRADQLAREGLLHLPEERGIFSDLTVDENVELLVGADARSEVYARFPVLGSRRQQRAATLSGGEQQMLAVSPIVATAPTLLLVDEVSLGLAPRIVEQLYEVLAEARGRGVTMVVVEQYVDRVLELCDHAVVLRKGQIVWNGDAAELQAAPDWLTELYLGGDADAA